MNAKCCLRAVALLCAITLPLAQLTLPPSVHADDGLEIRYYHPDHLGSTNVVTDKHGQVVQVLEYAPYGQVTKNVTTGSATVAHQFTGQRHDTSTGLYFYKARYYDPHLGRFIQPDPTVQVAADPQDLNRYAYARNNPLKYTDPTGYGWWSKFWGQVLSFIIGIGVTILTGGNFFLGFQAYSLSSSLIGAGQAIANGVSPWRVAASFGASVAISAIGAGIGIPDISSFGLRMAAFAEQGALMGLSSAAIMGGDLGAGAASGAGFGGLNGLATSQQLNNWLGGRGFVSDNAYAAAQLQKFGNGPQYGSLELYSAEGHAFLGLKDPQGNEIFMGKYPGGPGSGNASTVKAAYLLGKTARGAVLDERNMPFLGGAAKLVAKWNLTDGQYTAAYSYMKSGPGTFALTTNCAKWALQGLREVGLRAPTNLTHFGFTDPKQVLNWNGNSQ